MKPSKEEEGKKSESYIKGMPLIQPDIHEAAEARKERIKSFDINTWTKEEIINKFKKAIKIERSKKQT